MRRPGPGRYGTLKAPADLDRAPFPCPIHTIGPDRNFLGTTVGQQTDKSSARFAVAIRG